MALNTVYNTRTTDYEDLGQLLNVAKLSLTSPAAANDDAVRKQEFDAAIASITFDNVVESSETSLADYITANGTGLAEGTFLFLPNAPDRQNRYVRRDVATSNDGTANDFINVNAVADFIRSDLTDQYSGSDGIFIDDVNGFIGISDGTLALDKLNAEVMALVDSKDADVVSALTGDAATFTDLGLVEDELQSINSAITTHSHTESYSVTWGAPDGDGIATATIDTSTDFGTADVQVRIVKNLGDGYFEHISTATIEVATNATSVRLRTDSGSVIASTLTVFVTGTPV